MSEPPPVSTMPCSRMSLASSGGVISSARRTALTIRETGSWIASRTPGRVHPDRLGQAGHEVAALHVHLLLALERHRRAEPDLDPLGGGLADEEAVVLAHELDDGLVQLVAAGPDRGVAHDAAERDDRDVGGAAADVDDHAADRGLDRQADADRRRHRLGDHEQALDARPTGPSRARRGARPR